MNEYKNTTYGHQWDNEIYILEVGMHGWSLECVFRFELEYKDDFPTPVCVNNSENDDQAQLAEMKMVRSKNVKTESDETMRNRIEKWTLL